MQLHSDPKSHYSHRVRVVLSEKAIDVDIKDLSPATLPEEFSEINPFRTLPTLADKELVLYQTNIIMEYLEERFPYPALLPVPPDERSEMRLFIYRIDQEWSPLFDTILDESTPKEKVKSYTVRLTEELISMVPMFEDNEYFMGNDFSLVDCCLAPLFWRLSEAKIRIPQKKSTKALHNYMKRLFSRPGFHNSLSEWEQGIGDINIPIRPRNT